MNFSPKDRVITWAVPGVLACVLGLLAVLQYRWSRQASDAATTRMQASLQNSLMNFRQDLARELATMCLELQGDYASSVDAKTLAQELGHWQRTSSLAGLISNVYEWNRFGDKTSPLLHFLPSESRFETIVWPSRFDKLHELLTAGPTNGALESQGPHAEPDLDDALARGLRSTSKSVERGSKPHRDSDVPIIGGIDETIPVLIVPA